MMKVNDNRIRIVTKGPKDMDTQINVDEEIDEVDPFDNKIKVILYNFDFKQYYYFVM